MNNVRTRRGKPITSRYGLPTLEAVSGAQNAIALGETVSVTGEIPRTATISLPGSVEGSGFLIIWKGKDATGELAGHGFMFPIASGTISGDPDAVFGPFATVFPEGYSLHVVDGNGDIGTSTGYVSLTEAVQPFVVSSNPTLGACTENTALVLGAAVWSGEPSTVITDVFEIADDTSGTNGEAVTVTAGICPPIDGALDTLRYGQTFTTATGDALGTYWSPWVAITPGAVVTPVTNVTPPAFATAVLSYKSAVNTAGFVRGAVVASGSTSATVIEHVSLTATTGQLFTGAVTNGPFTNGAVITTTSGEATADGASATYVPTAGGIAAVTYGTYAGTPTSNVGRWERATDDAGTGAAEWTISGGRFPTTDGGLYDRYVERVTGYGIATYLDTATAWTLISSVPLVQTANDEWLLEDPSVISSTTDQMDTILSLVASDGLLWSTSTSENLDGSVFPAGWETASANGTMALVRLRYDEATTTAFDVGDTVTGGTSGKTGVVYRHVPLTLTTGTIFFVTTTGAFSDNETITASGASAKANGASASVTAYKWQVADAIAGTPPKNYRQFVSPGDDVRRTRVKITLKIGSAYTPRSFEKTLPNPPAPSISTTVSTRWTMRKEGQYLDKEIGGTGLQFPRCSATTPAKPGRVFCGIDVTRPTMTDNFGEWWTSPRLRRMYANMSSMGAGIDRTNGDYILFYASTGPNQISGVWNALNGVYVSPDGGATATLVLSLPDSPGSNRGSRRTLFHCLAQAPGGAAPGSRTWYCVHPKATWTPDALVNTQVYRSTNGGSNWSPVFGEQTAGWLNEVYGIECRVNGSGHDVYVWGEGGVKRYASGASSWSAVTGLPAGKTIYHVETTAAGHVYAVAAGTGLYKSTNGTAFSQILGGNYDCFAVAKAALPNGKRRVWVCSHTTSVAARWSDDDGDTWTHSGSNNVIKSIPFPDLSGENLGGNAVFFIPHETDPNECLVMRAQHMGRLILTAKNTDGNYEAVWSSRGYDYSRIVSVSWGSTYKDVCFGATDRASFISDHGANYTHSIPIDDAMRSAIYLAIEGTAGKYQDYQGGGPVILERNGHKRLVVAIGEGKVGGTKAPCVFGPLIEDQKKVAATNTGNLTSLVMPKGSLGGTYELRCTTAATNAGTFTLYGPVATPGQLGAVLGTTSGMGAQSIGGITFSLSDGSTDYVAGSNPSRFTWYYNPIGSGGLLSGAGGIANLGQARRGERNPTDIYKACIGRNLYTMDTSGVVTRTAGLAYEFYGYSDANVIWGVNGNNTMRSANEGSSWTTAHTAPGGWSNIQKTINSLYPSKADNTICFRCNDAGQVHRIDSSDNSATLVFDFLTVMAILDPGKTFAGGGTPPRPGAKSMTQDPFDANLLHVAVAYGGTSSVFRSTDGGDNWTDLTADGGLLQDGDIFVCPHTGEIVHFTQHGTEVFSTPSSVLLSESIKGDLDTFIGDAGDYVGV